MTPALAIPPTVADFLVLCQADDVRHVASVYVVTCARCGREQGQARLLRRPGGGTETALPEGWRARIGGVCCLRCATRGVRR